MQVTLRIVGLFFNKKVEKSGSFTTVQDVMDTYRGTTRDKTSKVGGLTYTVEEHDKSIKRISFHFDGNYDFEGDIPGNGNGKTLDGKDLSAQIFSLSERKLGAKSQLAWQYYVLDKNGINKSRTLQAEKFTTFGDTSLRKTYTIADGDTIIWRLVAINLPKREYYPA